MASATDQVGSPDRQRWLLVTASTAGASSLRVHVWRKLRSLGALYLQQSVCLLPATRPLTREVRRLLDRVHREGGTGRSFVLVLEDPAQQAEVIAELCAARDVEYADVLERVPAFLAELETERARGRVTYEEVEECEADLERFQSWLAKIEARDYFGAPRRAEVRAALGRCAEELAAFEEEALAVQAHEHVTPGG